MNVFEYAMKMEKDGQHYYEEQSAKSNHHTLKKLWQQLASDEIKHHEIFRRMRDGEIKEAAKMSKLGTEILGKAKTVFEEMKESDQNLDFGEDVIAAWNKAQDMELATEKFYRDKEKEEKQPEIKSSFHLLAAEEHKHVLLIEHVLNFLNGPRSWLEDAEWSNLDND